MPLELATGIAHWLRSRQSSESGRVVDSAHQVPGTYADGFAALVFSLLDWSEPRDRALQVSLRRGPDSEFDSLAQALILQLAPEGLSERLSARPLYAGGSLVSNNWGLFRALTRTLRGQLVPDFSAVHKQLPQGLFPDSPIGVATPVCYHAKMCATLALLESFRPQAVHRQALQRGLQALVALVSPQGALVPYGRSRNTLFAYGSAYLALRLGARLFDESSYAWAAAAVLRHMKKFQHSDGHIPAALNGHEWLRQDWDIYINNPDYNAYAAACLLMADRLGAPEEVGTAPEPACHDLGPLLVCRQPEGYFACSTTGEFAPYGSPFFCDTRYAGVVPLIYDDGEQLRSFDESYCWDGRDSTRGALVDPRLSDWIPYLEVEGRRYWVRLYGDVQWSLQGQMLSLSGRGLPVACQPIPRWRRFVAGRLSRQPVAQMIHRHLPDLLETTLICDFSQGRVRSNSHYAASPAHLQRGTVEEPLLCPTLP